jgi:hypothetical protein
LGCSWVRRERILPPRSPLPGNLDMGPSRPCLDGTRHRRKSTVQRHRANPLYGGPPPRTMGFDAASRSLPRTRFARARVPPQRNRSSASDPPSGSRYRSTSYVGDRPCLSCAAISQTAAPPSRAMNSRRCSFDHLVGLCEKRFGDRQPDCLCGYLLIDLMFLRTFAQITSYPSLYRAHSHLLSRQSGKQYLSISIGQFILSASLLNSLRMELLISEICLRRTTTAA